MIPSAIEMLKNIGMFLGFFLQQISNDLIPVSSFEELAPGSVVVAVSDIQRLRDTGIPCFLRFGIVAGAHEVICQCCESNKVEIADDIQFSIRELPVEDFAEGKAKIYTCQTDSKRTLEHILVASKMRVGITYYHLRSYPGDDFVAEMLYGQSVEDLITSNLQTGQHWWTPLQMTLREGLKWLGVKFPDERLPEVVDIQVFNQTHHGIAIEGGQVIHFSTCRVPGGTNLIKTDSLKEFRSIGDDENCGSAVKYKEETPEQRLTSRNRAVWVFCHADSWGAYNLLDNNCEHFSRFCRVGKKESRQVVSAVMELAGTLLSILPRKVPFAPFILTLGLLLRNCAKVLGRPEPVK